MQRPRSFDDELTLIKETSTFDDYGRPKVVETTTTVLCKVISISQREDSESRQLGIRLSKKFVIHSFEYNHETIVKYKDKRYLVDRVYGEELDETELTCVELRNG